MFLSQRPRAKFEPISPDLDVASMVESTPNFEYVSRINCDAIDRLGLDMLDELVQQHVALGGKPLVVEGFDRLLDPVFSTKWLRQSYSDKSARSSFLLSSSCQADLCHS